MSVIRVVAVIVVCVCVVPMVAVIMVCRGRRDRHGRGPAWSP